MEIPCGSTVEEIWTESVFVHGYDSYVQKPKHWVDELPTRSAENLGRLFRKFQNRTPKKESFVVVNHGWQSESTDGLKGGWSCVFWSGYNG